MWKYLKKSCLLLMISITSSNIFWKSVFLDRYDQISQAVWPTDMNGISNVVRVRPRKFVAFCFSTYLGRVWQFGSYLSHKSIFWKIFEGEMFIKGLKQYWSNKRHNINFKGALEALMVKPILKWFRRHEWLQPILKGSAGKNA